MSPNQLWTSSQWIIPSPPSIGTIIPSSRPVIRHLTSIRKKYWFPEMWPTYWRPHQKFLCTPLIIRPYELVLFWPLSIYLLPEGYACYLLQQIYLENISTLHLWYLILPIYFYAITCCHPRTKQWYIVFPKSTCSQHTYYKCLFQKPNPIVLYRRDYPKKMQTRRNHTFTQSLIDTKYFPHFHTSHAAYALGWPDTWCQQSPS